MLFNSFEFLVFFIITTIAFFAFPHKYRWFLLLVASCIFYMFFIPIYILILCLTIIVDYIAGIYIENSSGQKRKNFLILSLVTNISILGIFKYYNFFIDNVNTLFGALHLNVSQLKYLPIILPIGLSFHTFQAMSYTIEVYRGNQKAEKHFGIFALYVMFYPQLVAGPIERPQNMLHQFHEKKVFNWERLESGLKWMLWGLFKKVVIADRLAIMVDNVYNNPTMSHGFALFLATLLFAFQIYCDFSGYSDMALGSARIMGFDLMVNFKQPYFSKSISEFWTRWHISLSTWFKDYLYIPLGGNRVKVSRLYFNLCFVFLISGIWHGANWTFIIWGGLHGIFLILGQIKDKNLKFIKFPKYINILITFFLVVITWIFFRANNLADAMYFLKHIFISDWNKNYFSIAATDVHGNPDTYLGIAKWKFLGSLILIPILIVVDYLFYTNQLVKLLGRSITIRWSIFYIVILAILFFGVFDTKQFIYFQF